MVSNFIYRVFNSRFIFIVVMMSTFLMFCFGQLVDEQTMLKGVEAYVLYMNSKSSLIYWIACIAIGANYPVNDTYGILRIGRKKWITRESLYLIGQIMILNLCILIVLLINFSGNDISKWSMTSIMMVNNQSLYGAHLGAIYDITGWIMMNTPEKLCILTFMLRSMCGIIVGVICMAFSMKRKLLYGAFFIALLYYLPVFINRILEHTSRLVAIIDIFGMGMLDNISIAFYSQTYSLGFVFGWYTFVIICLYMLINDGSKKVEVY